MINFHIRPADQATDDGYEKVIMLEIEGIATPVETMELGLKLIDVARREGVTFGDPA
jgi:hypothetical protein